MARRHGQGRTIDFKAWNAMPSLLTEVSGVGTSQGGALSFTSPATILRCRGYVSAFFDESVQIGDEYKLIFGLGISSTDAFTAGAMPDPGSEPEYPWLWWDSAWLECYLAAGQEGWGTTAQRFEIDTRAMRKVKPGQTLTLIVQSTGVGGAPATKIAMGRIRVLIGT